MKCSKSKPKSDLFSVSFSHSVGDNKMLVRIPNVRSMRKRDGMMRFHVEGGKTQYYKTKEVRHVRISNPN